MTTDGSTIETDGDSNDSNDVDPARIAREATIHSFLNCYLRETGNGTVVPLEETPLTEEREVETVLRCVLESQGVTLFVPLAYESPTGRHQFDLPARYRPGPAESLLDLDYLTLVTLVTKELERTRNGDGDRDPLVRRVIQSCGNIEAYVRTRSGDEETLYGTTWEFLDAEQSLVFGHLMHPTPKSRSGMERNAETYAPERNGSFALSWVRADPSIVEEGSARPESASSWVASWLRADPAVPEAFVAEHVESDDVLLPVHPWQAEYLRAQSAIRDRCQGGQLTFLGQVGREFYPTSSVRTLYAPAAPFMVKGSLAVKITNSKRENKRAELERGVAIADLLETSLGEDLRGRFPDFGVVRDPAYLTVDVGDAEESGFEVVLRENIFRGDAARRVTPVVALCQDGIGDASSRLSAVISEIAAREQRSLAAVSEEWFERYLAISLRPVLWLYLEWGLGLEAHQQNSVLGIDDSGYPERFWYRDNQGYYFPEGAYERVSSVMPGVGERADTLCPDAVADERIRYYVVLNNAFGVINAFGTAGLVDERRLLGVLRSELEDLRSFYRETSQLLDPLLESATVPCKANLLTRFRGLDELDADSLDEQSVYAAVHNPLADRREGSL